MPTPMPPQDAAFLLIEARERPMHVGGLQVFDLPDGADPTWVTERYDECLTWPEVHPRLSRRPVRGLGSAGAWAWERDDNLDLEYHVRHSALPHPYRVRELLALTSRLHGTLLDRSRPLWEAHLIEGLQDDQFAIYTKIHHALVDGMAAMKLLERSMSPDADERDMPPPFAPPRHRAPRRDRQERPDAAFDPLGAVRSLVGGATAGAQALSGASMAGLQSVLRGFTKEAAVLPFQAPATMLNVPITGARRFAADRWPLDRVKGVAKTIGGTLNDVVLAMCSGALRRYLEDHDALPDTSLVAMVPVSLRAEGDEESGNAVGVILCRLGTDEASPERRYAAVRASMREGKQRFDGLPPLAIMMLSAAAVSGLALGPLSRLEPLKRPPFNVVISNVPGPRETLHWNGAPMTGHYPVSIPTDGQALNITVTSYAGHLNVGLTGDRRSLPSLQRMLTHLETSLAELEAL